MYKVNLLPSELRTEVNYSRWKVLSVRILILMIIFLLSGIYCGFLYQYRLLEQNSLELKKLLQEKTTDLQNVELFKQDKLKTEKTINNLGDLLKNRIIWSKLLLDLDILRTSDLQFTELKMQHSVNVQAKKNKTKSVSVVYITGKADSIISVTNLYKNLLELSYLQEVKLQSIEQKINSQEFKFIITAIMIKENNYDQ